MAIGPGRQLRVLLAPLRFSGSWQPRRCHNPRPRNARPPQTATTPEIATQRHMNVTGREVARPSRRVRVYHVPYV